MIDGVTYTLQLECSHDGKTEIVGTWRYKDHAGVIRFPSEEGVRHRELFHGTADRLLRSATDNIRRDSSTDERVQPEPVYKLGAAILEKEIQSLIKEL